MIAFFLWYLVISLAGLVTFPLVFRLLVRLPDRGYTLSRSLGLLLWGFLLWLLASLGLLRNEPGGILFALALVAALSALSLWRWRSEDWQNEWRDWWQAHRSLVIVTELLFLAAFSAWSIVRAANPEALGTEKPMELAFINAILRSPTFPPHDPWLSGYAISYYYFGYVLVAMIARLTAVNAGIAFNLGIALTFALSALGAFGLVYNLLSLRITQRSNQAGFSSSGSLHRSISSLLGPIFLLLVSNLAGFLQSFHNRGLFWTHQPSGEWTSGFWRWLDIQDLNIPPNEPLSWIPDRFWWWWRASRVLQDYDLSGSPREIIDEFPFFSYLLGDLHPHVLAMPFALLAMALALNVFSGGFRSPGRWLSARFSLRATMWVYTFTLLACLAMLVMQALRLRLIGFGLLGLAFVLSRLLPSKEAIWEIGLPIFWRSDTPTIAVHIPLFISLPGFLLSGVVLGGLAFLNTWDFPFYVALFAAAYAIGRFQCEDPVDEASHQNEFFSSTEIPADPHPSTPTPYLVLLRDFLLSAILIGLAGIFFYLPFYLGFSSQAGGIIPNLIYITRGAHLWVMFGTLLIPLFCYLAYLVIRAMRKPGDGAQSNTNELQYSSLSPSTLLNAAIVTTGFLLLIWLAVLVFAFGTMINPDAAAGLLGSFGASDIDALYIAAVTRRLIQPGAWITLAALLVLVLALLFHFFNHRFSPTQGRAGSAPTLFSADLFAVLLILLGILLVLGPEFFFLRDQFGWRMNTIFKFYYQAWHLWAAAAAYGSIVLLSRLRGGWDWAFRGVILFVLLAGLAYPIMSLPNKTNGFQPAEWTLDASAYFTRQSPDEAAAIQWLSQAEPGPVAEAVSPSGGSYTGYARVATLSGQPAVLGWVGHESQWRGGGSEMGSRQPDLERLYCTRDAQETLELLDRYEIRYVFVGDLERTTYTRGPSCPYGLVETKFERALDVVFRQGNVVIYAVP